MWPHLIVLTSRKTHYLNTETMFRHWIVFVDCQRHGWASSTAWYDKRDKCGSLNGVWPGFIQSPQWVSPLRIVCRWMDGWTPRQGAEAVTEVKQMHKQGEGAHAWKIYVIVSFKKCLPAFFIQACLAWMTFLHEEKSFFTPHGWRATLCPHNSFGHTIQIHSWHYWF